MNMKKFAPYIPIVGIFLVFYYIIVKLDYEFSKKFSGDAVQFVGSAVVQAVSITTVLFLIKYLS